MIADITAGAPQPDKPMQHKRISTFYEEQKHLLYSYALSLTGCPSKAEDAVHTAICKLLSAFILPQQLKPYAYRCIRNAAIDDWRKFAGRASVLPDEPDHPDTNDKPSSQDLEALLQKLTPEERETVVLKAIHGFTFKEISAISKSSINTISSRYRRTLEKLKILYEEDSHE